MEGIVRSGAFREDGGGGGSFVVGGAVIPTAGDLLGAYYNPGNYPVLTGRGSHCFLAAFRWDPARGGPRWDCGEPLRGARACIRRLRVPAGPALCADAF